MLKTRLARALMLAALVLAPALAAQSPGPSDAKYLLPPQAAVANLHFSPDSSKLSFTNIKENGIELWVADATTGASKLLSGTDKINDTTGDPCDWLKDNATLVCKTVPTGRAPAPAEPAVPMGPNVHESSGRAAPAATYEDMIKTAHDEALFDYYFTSQLASFDVATGRK